MGGIMAQINYLHLPDRHIVVRGRGGRGRGRARGRGFQTRTQW